MPDIPLPSRQLKHRCTCGKSFWLQHNYFAHYALEHIVLGEYPL